MHMKYYKVEKAGSYIFEWLLFWNTLAFKNSLEKILNFKLKNGIIQVLSLIDIQSCWCIEVFMPAVNVYVEDSLGFG